MHIKANGSRLSPIYDLQARTVKRYNLSVKLTIKSNKPNIIDTQIHQRCCYGILTTWTSWSRGRLNRCWWWIVGHMSHITYLRCRWRFWWASSSVLKLSLIKRGASILYLFSLCCPMRNLYQMTIGKTLSTLCSQKNYIVTKNIVSYLIDNLEPVGPTHRHLYFWWTFAVCFT